MNFLQDIAEHTLTTSYVEGSDTPPYWLDGNTVMYGSYPIRGADASSFRFYLGCFAKDNKHCYIGSAKLKLGNGSQFKALNYTYATDGNIVCSLGGRIADADGASFMICDDGVLIRDGLRFPYGYGKDNVRVFYYDFDGKANWVKKADPATFKSLNDGFFGLDHKTVFCGHASIAKADVNTWQKLGGYYSRDKARIFYFNREIKVADYATFRVIASKDGARQLARDCNHFYWNDRVIDYDAFGIDVWREGAMPDVAGDYPAKINK